MQEYAHDSRAHGATASSITIDVARGLGPATFSPRVDQPKRSRFGSFTGCVKTEEWSALEPDVLENTYYCPMIGLVLETTVRGDAERNELVGLTSP
jgi:hypothetical protein